MNPRKLLLSNLAWCPGVATAAKFAPDRDISTRTMLVSATILLVMYSYSVLFIPQQRLGEPLMVTVRDSKGETRLLDTEFTEDYDYSCLWGKRVLFYDVARSSDYSATSERETINIEFETLHEVEGYLRNQSMPNVVTGFTMYFLDQYVNLSVNDPDGLSDLPQGKLLGDEDPGVCYLVSSELGLGTFSGLSIDKFSGRRTLFRIQIDAGEIISNMLTGYPDDPVYKIVHWKVPK